MPDHAVLNRAYFPPLRQRALIRQFARRDVLAPVVPLLLGLDWFLAGLGAFLRDVGQITSLLVNPLMFLSPVFYPVGSVPERAQPRLLAKPLTPVIEQLRRVALDGLRPERPELALRSAIASIFAWAGARRFAATRKGFADVT